MGLEKEVQEGMFKGKEMECRGDRRAGLGPCTDDAVKAKGFVSFCVGVWYLCECEVISRKSK